MYNELISKLEQLAKVFRPVRTFKRTEGAMKNVIVKEASHSVVLTAFEHTGLTQLELLLVELVSNGILGFTLSGLKFANNEAWTVSKLNTHTNNEYEKLADNVSNIVDHLVNGIGVRSYSPVVQKHASEILLAVLTQSEKDRTIETILSEYQWLYSKSLHEQATMQLYNIAKILLTIPHVK